MEVEFFEADVGSLVPDRASRVTAQFFYFLVPFVFAITVFGTSIQFCWHERISGFKDKLIQDHIERIRADNDKYV